MLSGCGQALGIMVLRMPASYFALLIRVKSNISRKLL